jgi:hypothetical protein
VDDDDWECETCERRIRTDALGVDDRLALDLYHDLAHPAVRELGLTRIVFDAHGLIMSRADVMPFLRRLEAIHEFVCEESRLRADKERQTDG